MIRDAIKRLMDFTLSAYAILMLAPIMFAIGILIKLDSPGPVFYKQVRIGKGGKPFKMWKFRTMVNNSHSCGSKITYNNDSRITKVGSFIRSIKFDELPNLFNILKGDMSIVGPRPEIPEYIRRYDKRMEKVFSVKPGLTGPSQIIFFNEEKMIQKKNIRKIYRKIQERKIDLDREYAEQYNPITDIKLIGRTIVRIFQPQDDGMPESI
ncbi:MAG: sugar transferase [Candidatus Coatesbacteria bacterium]|nr:MAG: sugar transferase [Candidatus Coatesbacteria bacterium]RLC42871.1 MAG: sugar transferase [Candidatus Coatesbacteria bacterium]RLC44939.1 MAG: sugar transferase [Candidatus Coatesbacteria bacterium]